MKYFTDLLLNEYVHFLEEVLSVYEEKNRGTGKNKPKYFGKISFDSRILENQSAINYEGPPGMKTRTITKVVAPVEPIQQSIRTTKIAQTPKYQAKSLGNNIVIFAPQFTIKMEILEAIKAELRGVMTLIESDTYSKDFLSTSDSQLNLILLNSLKGLIPVDRIQSHTEKIYYFLVNYTSDNLELLA